LLAVLVSIVPWKPKISKLPLESFFESVISAIRYVRYSHGIRIILIRNAIFSFFIAIIPALLPVVGLKELHVSPSNLGLLFASMGIGSVLAAVLILPWARARRSYTGSRVQLRPFHPRPPYVNFRFLNLTPIRLNISVSVTVSGKFS
jgi:hypothetical protein